MRPFLPNIMHTAWQEMKAAPEIRIVRGLDNDNLDMDKLEGEGWEALQLGREESILVNTNSLARLEAAAVCLMTLVERIPEAVSPYAEQTVNVLLAADGAERELLPERVKTAAMVALSKCLRLHRQPAVSNGYLHP